MDRFTKHLLAGTMLAGVGTLGVMAPAQAANVCPAVGYATLGCDLIITLNSNGTASVTPGPSAGIPTFKPGTYDGSDDTLIGLVNNSGGSVNKLFLSANTDIFGFDGDGIEPNPNPTSGQPGLGLTTAPPGYQGTDSTTGSFNLAGPFNSFSGTTPSKDAGIVNFPGGIPYGGSAFWSLEEPLTAASFTKVSTCVPEPASMLLLGAAFAGFGMLRRRKKA